MLIRMIVAGVLVLAAGGLGIAFLANRPAPVTVVEAPRPEPVVVAPPPPAAKAAMLVAARPLSAGTLVKDEDFAVREVPPEALPDGALVQSEEVRVELRGALLRRYLDVGAVVSRGDVLRPRDRGFLAAVLRPGARAIAVGVDQHFTQGASAGLLATGGNNQRSVARTVTLEVQPDQAERVAVAERLGRLSLTVRSMEQGADQVQSDATPTSIFGADVSPSLSRSGPALGSRIRVIQGDDSQEITFR
jgi:pilus assembly protein CpaB